jgi:FG-GAP repeat
MQRRTTRARSLVVATAAIGGIVLAPTTSHAAASSVAVTRLAAPASRPSAFLGAATAISGDTLVVGAPATATSQLGGQGAVYVYTRPPAGTWAHAKVAVLTSSTSLPTSEGTNAMYTPGGFGVSVAISGSTIVVGQPNVNQVVGAVDVFTRPAAGWRTTSRPTAVLTAAASADAITVGYSVAIAGNTIVSSALVGSPATRGAVVFTRPSAGTWTSEQSSATLTTTPASFAGSGGTLFKVAATSSLIALGDSDEDISLFAKPASGWHSMSQTRELGDPTTGTSTDDALGSSLAISGTTVLVGAPDVPYLTNDPPGGVAVYPMPKGGWTASTSLTMDTKELRVGGATHSELVGSSIAVSGKELVVTAPGYAVKGATIGAVYVFTPGKSGWATATQTARLPLAQPRQDTEYAASVAASGSTIAVGAEWSNHYAGAAYVYAPNR